MLYIFASIRLYQAQSTRYIELFAISLSRYVLPKIKRDARRNPILIFYNIGSVLSIKIKKERGCVIQA